MRHPAKKHLGQNFLTDIRTQSKIIEHCRLSSEDVVLEIGPGRGAMTRLIAPKVKKLICIETDADLIAALKEEFSQTHVEIIHGDFLKLDLCRLDIRGNLKVIGNIPYYISTPIIEKLIEDRECIESAYLTVQLEFGQRLAAGGGSKEYGSLSCFTQYHAAVQMLFKIKNTCFRPIPKVDSCFVCLDFSRKPPYHPKDEAFLFKLVRTAFTQRRKTLVNALAGVVDKGRLLGVLEGLNISAKSRPEELNLHNFVDISNRLI